MSGLTSTYTDLRRRGEGDVARTIEVISGRLMLDVDDDGRVLGIETIGPDPMTMADLWACLAAARYPDPSGGSTDA